MHYTEGVSFIIKEATRITGLALNPQVSRNGVLYTPAVLQANDNKVVPMYLNHNVEGGQIGTALLTYSEERLALTYTATITDEDVAQRVKENTWKVSIGGEAGGEVKVECDRNRDHCFEIPEMVNITELSLLEPDIPAGIPTASVSVIECAQCKYHSDTCDCNECVKGKQIKKVIAKDLKKIKECTDCLDDCECSHCNTKKKECAKCNHTEDIPVVKDPKLDSSTKDEAVGDLVLPEDQLEGRCYDDENYEIECDDEDEPEITVDITVDENHLTNKQFNAFINKIKTDILLGK